MNDRHLDPPEYDEPPECCGDLMNITDDGDCICPLCGRMIIPELPPEPPDDPRELEADYWHDELRDRKLEPEEEYDFEKDDMNYDASRERK